MFRKPAITWPPAIFECLSGVAKGGRYRGHAPLKFTKTEKNDVKTSTHFAYIKHSHEPLQIFFGNAITTCLFLKVRESC